MLPPAPTPSTPAQRRLDFTAADPDAFGAYHDLYRGGSTVSRLGDTFSATVVAHRFPRMLLFDRRVVGAVHHRDAAQARRDGLDHYTLQVLRSGRMLAGRAGEERAMRPGDVAVYGTTRPQRTVVERAHYIALTLPRDVVEAALPGARALHGTILPRAAVGLLGDFIRSLVRNAAAIGPDAASRGGTMMAELLAGAVGAAGWQGGKHVGARWSGGDPGGGTGGEAEQVFALQRARADAYIEANLHDRDLDADRMAAALGLSRATLYRAFAPLGGIARQILRRRLERLRTELARPGETRSVAALGFDLGFASESHCGRAFKGAFGIAPGQFRAEARRVRRDNDMRAAEPMAWYRDLR